MIRQDIRIGDYSNNGQVEASYKYIVDFYKAGVDYKDTVYNKFVMLRRYRIVNSIPYDTDIYLVERSLIEQDEPIIFPMANGVFVGFSDDPVVFNEYYNSKLTIGSDEVYELYNKDERGEMHIADIPCDKINIYHPHNKNELQSILYADTVINTVKFHILCKKYTDLPSNAEEDFNIDGINYSEYATCYIPDIDYILNSGEVYYKEDLTIVDTDYSVETYDDVAMISDDNEPVTSDDTSTELSTCSFLIEHSGREWRNYSEEDMQKELILSPFNSMSPDDNVYVALKLYTIPFSIYEDSEGRFVKKYVLTTNDSVAQDYVTWPVRVTIYPYTYVDETTKIYINTSSEEANSDVFQDNAMMSLSAKFGFNETHIPSVLCTFQFPGKDRFNSFAEAYEYFYGVSLEDYEGIVEYDEDGDEDDYTVQKQCGFRMALYSDWEMRSEICHEYFEIEKPDKELDDFSFALNGIFTKWEQLPDTVIVQTKFIDKWLGNIITSNPVIISPEMYKYMVCDDNDNRSIVKWEGTQNDIKKIDEMDLSNTNFIDKIHCTIVQTSGDKDKMPVSNTAPRIVYKPVFFRTQDLQNIRLVSGLVQNVGINLAEYMTKVDAFRITIGGQEMTESARNDIYVIFSINAQLLGTVGSTGSYHISNKDGDYISTGTYEVI